MDLLVFEVLLVLQQLVRILPQALAQNSSLPEISLNHYGLIIQVLYDAESDHR